MATLRIVHLSDLHFVPDSPHKQRSVWNRVAAFVNDEVQPDAVLVTGDVTDSATHREFEFARQCLAELRPRMRPAAEPPLAIVAGNHDRFLYRGNGTPPWYTRFGPGWWPKDKAMRFDGTFRDFPVAEDRGRTVVLGPAAGAAGVEWRVRLLGLDSTALPQWFAQGGVSRKSIDAAREGALADPDADLVIALVHHHVLPIPALEHRAEAARLRRALDFTGMVNAGTLLDALSAAQVDLLLHGHEHVPHRAHFSGASAHAGRLAVLSAGSGTGDETLAGWRLERVHFNVIELEDDRSVWLRQVSGAGGALAFVEGREQRIPLLRAEDIRASRFVRRQRAAHGGPAAAAAGRRELPLPTSRLRKVVEFLPNRDIVLTESLTQWSVEPVWRHTTANGSGILSEASMRFDWDAEHSNSFRVPSVRDRDHPGRRQFVLEPNEGQARDAERITVRYTWHGGAALTRAEHDSLPQAARGGARKDGHEFAAALARGELEELRLTVRVPPRFAPRGAAVQAFYIKPIERGGGDVVLSDEFRRGLEFCGDGYIELHVPYPIPGYRYGVRWPVLEESSRDAEWSALRERLCERVEEVRRATREALMRRGWSDGVRVDLYAEPAGEVAYRLFCVGRNEGGPASVSLRQERTLARSVYWCEPTLAYDFGDKADHGDAQPDETRILLMPLRGSPDPLHEAFGLLRVAWTRAATSGLALSDWEPAVRLMAAELTPQVVQMAR